ncbi:helix-turn-helix transcriptional regulator [Leucobacter chinensis]|uniref:helix-turn-helix transcriptional regulator n=1 Tax=Leucobacter chinensis TaxID=2851010 RepID=UPI0020B73578|nr:helix-turn-helix transcriptional regulator [Leucobacter chinensis]
MPTDLLYMMERVSLTTEMDLAGLRSMTPNLFERIESNHSQAEALLHLENGKLYEAIEFMTPLLARDEPTMSRSAIDALVILVQALAEPEALKRHVIEATLQRSAELWQDGEPSGFVLWASMVAFVAQGNLVAATRWREHAAGRSDEFGLLARATFELGFGDATRVHEVLVHYPKDAFVRLTHVASVLRAVAWLYRENEERALLEIEAIWREHTAPKLMFFALLFASTELVECLLDASEKYSWRLAEVIDRARGMRLPLMRAQRYPLTESECAVLRGIYDGLTNQAIAEERFVTLGTVRSQIKSIYRKLNVSGREEAIAVALRRELL